MQHRALAHRVEFLLHLLDVFGLEPGGIQQLGGGRGRPRSIVTPAPAARPALAPPPPAYSRSSARCWRRPSNLIDASRLSYSLDELAKYYLEHKPITYSSF